MIQYGFDNEQIRKGVFIRFIQNQREKQCPFQVALLKISVNHEDFKRVSLPRFGWYGNDRPGISSTILMISVLTIECWPSQSQYHIRKKEAGTAMFIIGKERPGISSTILMERLAVLVLLIHTCHWH